MVRSIAGVVVGYLLMVIFVFVTFSIAYVAMGTERAFLPESFEVSALWIGASLVLGLIAAIIGGLVCRKLSRHGRAPLVLALLVLILGLAMAIPALRSPDEGQAARTGEIGNFEAMQQAHQPDWITLANPIIGFFGVLIGAGRRRRRNSTI